MSEPTEKPDPKAAGAAAANAGTASATASASAASASAASASAASAAQAPDPAHPSAAGFTFPQGPVASSFLDPDPLTSQDPLAAAQAEVAALKAKVTDLQDQYVRGQAEVQNARRRADDEVSKARKFALESFADSLLPVLDSLEAGLAIQTATPEQIREGAQATLRQLKSALARNKVIAIDPAAGTKFDPAQHQAISVVPLPADSTQDANTVVAVLQKGYLIAERVLRPALVTVSAPK